jgi:hypothetical protein
MALESGTLRHHIADFEVNTWHFFRRLQAQSRF